VNAEDAMWWSVSTMTTVGYGDRYPITSEGRLVAVFLMAAGVGLFSDAKERRTRRAYPSGRWEVHRPEATLTVHPGQAALKSQFQRASLTPSPFVPKRPKDRNT